jgi:hypothetical protein
MTNKAICHHWVLFLFGVAAFIFGNCCPDSYLKWQADPTALTYAIALIAAYFWIRHDIWNESATTSGEKSKRADSRMAYVLLFLITIIQCYSFYKSEQSPKANFLIYTILVGSPICNVLASFADQIFSWVIQRWFK